MISFSIPQLHCVVAKVLFMAYAVLCSFPRFSSDDIRLASSTAIPALSISALTGASLRDAEGNETNGTPRGVFDSHITAVISPTSALTSRWPSADSVVTEDALVSLCHVVTSVNTRMLICVDG